MNLDSHSVSDLELEANNECSPRGDACDVDMPNIATNKDDTAGAAVDVAVSFHSLQDINEADYESSSNSDDDEMVSDGNIKQQLGEWTVSYNVQQSAVVSLLYILGPHFPNLPRDSRTLLNTKRFYGVKPIKGGHYCHVDLSKGLMHFVENSSIKVDHLELQINVDGVPLLRSSITALWPILRLMENVNPHTPFFCWPFLWQRKSWQCCRIFV